MTHELKARICTDALIAPLDDLSALFLKVTCPDRSEIIASATAVKIDGVAQMVRDHFGLDVMPLILADIEKHHRSTHPYSLTMPDDLIALIEPVMAEAAE